jgi:hypothetical protein
MTNYTPGWDWQPPRRWRARYRDAVPRNTRRSAGNRWRSRSAAAGGKRRSFPLLPREFTAGQEVERHIHHVQRAGMIEIDQADVVAGVEAGEWMRPAAAISHGASAGRGPVRGAPR